MRGWILVLAMCAACEESRPFCVEDDVAIQQGFYGQLLSLSDVGGIADSPHRDTNVDVFSGHVTMPPSAAFASTRTDESGVYQLEVPVGDYSFCTTSSCTPASLVDQTLVRFDYLVSPFFGVSWVLVSEPRCYNADGTFRL